MEAHRKVTAEHLRRDAYLYVRQSTLRQVVENTESTTRQYALRQRAVALGWRVERVIVIDSDLGLSGTSTADREGFQQLVAEVGMGKAGIVLGLEVSRLARNNADWHRLLEICALTRTLICDEDGLYDPCEFNDRLLLGLKGAMSEAETHVLRSRLRGGILSKARRGELMCELPMGFCYDPDGQVVLDPDMQVQEVIRHFFATFMRTGSARATIKALAREGVSFPKRLRSGPRKGELTWGPLYHYRALQLLHNPRYAGAFFFGRRSSRKLPDGTTKNELVPQDQWHALLKDAHVGYITWDEFEANQRRLRESAQSRGAERCASPPREGTALLQGIVLCGVCGARMTVSYHVRRGSRLPNYICRRDSIRSGARICQSIAGTAVDDAIAKLLLATVTPMALEVALDVQRELESRIDEADRLRAKHVERARYEAEHARRRYMSVDPDNRLVADSLEAEWNERLRAVAAAQDDYERQRTADRNLLSKERQDQILALATNFPALWRDPNTEQRDRKRMVRLLIEDVTLAKGEEIVAYVRYKGGQSKSLSLPIPLPAWQLRKTSEAAVREVDRLLDEHNDAAIAAILNERGLTSGEGKPFQAHNVRNLRHSYGLKSRFDRLRATGMLTLKEIAEQLSLSTATVKIWRRDGLLRAHAYNDKGEHLYEPPGPDAPTKQQGRKRVREVVSDQTEEVHCEA